MARRTWMIFAVCLTLSCTSNGGSGTNFDDDVETGDVNVSDLGEVWIPDAADYGGCAPYATSGPYAVGVATLDLDGVPVEVWYPAADGAELGHSKAFYDMRTWLPEAEREKLSGDQAVRHQMNAYRNIDVHTRGPFPVVLFSHGLAGYRMQSSFLTVHLASHGFVVAAPEHPERGLAQVVEFLAPRGDDSVDTLRATLELLRSANTLLGHPFRTRLDFSRVAVMGHSAGGRAALSLRADSDIRAVISYAHSGQGSGLNAELARPTFLMGGNADFLSPTTPIRGTYESLAAPKRFLSLATAGHLAFSDICALGRDRGGLLQIARDNGIDVPQIVFTLGQDGCTDDNLSPEFAWPLIKHYTTAYLRHAFGEDASPVGLGDETAACLGDVVEESLSQNPG